LKPCLENWKGLGRYHPTPLRITPIDTVSSTLYIQANETTNPFMNDNICYVAAKKLGRRYLCVDMKEEYV